MTRATSLARLYRSTADWRCRQCRFPIAKWQWTEMRPANSYESTGRKDQGRIGYHRVARPDLRIVADGDPVLQRWCLSFKRRYKVDGVNEMLPRSSYRPPFLATPCQPVIKNLKTPSNYTRLHGSSSEILENCNKSVTDWVESASHSAHAFLKVGKPDAAQLRIRFDFARAISSPWREYVAGLALRWPWVCADYAPGCE